MSKKTRTKKAVKVCVVNREGKKWMFDGLSFEFNRDDGIGRVIGVNKTGPPDTILLTLEAEDKADLKAVFYDTYCVKEVDADSASGECKKSKFDDDDCTQP